MTRRISKVNNEEMITAKKTVRKTGRLKKEEAESSLSKTVSKRTKKQNDIRIEVSRDGVKKTVFEQELENEKQLNRRAESFAIYEKEERKKIMIMWAGVGVVMFFIVGFWIYDTRKIFEQNRLEPSASADFSLDKLSESVREVSGKIDEFKQELAKASSTLATTTINQEIATSTATSTILSDLASSTMPISTSTVPKPELLVQELQEKLMASTTDNGEVKGVFEERDIINELKNKLENK